MNKYYEMFKEGNVDEGILDVSLGNASFEDHFWHLACVSKYYQNTNNSYLEKMCLRKLCDLNYAYAAIIYFDKEGVLPKKYKQYLIHFEHQMNDDLLEERIK